ncbi:DUF3019 domain-containing protein [Alteromonas halophila]|uniref:DUF3019 domain-containing protein n=1 Tax=Alteromonas halophila TaxID=516698 RepID=A0A918JI87_9ALTE|nr:DUF3019 domain-containing protein [Alteromonas halophila]GGW81400.1 hypothetical protein GCM10007391_13220 [Alteromonas halophila]
MLRILLCAGLLITASATDAVEWEVQPGACLVSSDDEFCQADVEVQIEGITPLPCLRVNEKPAGCFTSNRMILPLKITRDTRFTLLSAEGEKLDSFLLPYQIIEQRPRRRRVRLPWSVFE